MSVCIRLARFGRIHRPFYRIVAIDKRNAREGLTNEILGTYDPLLKDKNISIQMDRVETWVTNGAVISEALVTLLKHNGYVVPTTKAKPAAEKKPEAKRDGKKWVAPSRRALLKHKAVLKAARKIETAKTDDAAKAAKAAAAAKTADAPTEAPKA